MTLRAILIAAAAAFAIALPAQAQEPQFLAKHGDWTAHTKNEGGRQVCFMWSRPTKSQGNYSSRGEIVTFVTIFKPAPTGEQYYAGGQVSIVAGYTYQEDSQVTAAIGGKAYTLYTQGDTAWAANGTDDQTLIGAMKAGSNMVVKGRSWRPTDTTDTYSLIGFTAAYEAIAAACS